METQAEVGTVRALWVFPVKSMQGEEVETCELTPGGIAGDRAYAVVDVATGKVASAKHAKLWPALIDCRAKYVDEPRPGADAPPAEIELPDGTSVRTDAPDVDAVLSRFFGRDVRLDRQAPEDFTIDQYHPDAEDLDPAGHRDEIVATRLGAALFREMGMPSLVPEGSFLDLCPVSVMTLATLDRLSELRPESTFDVRRFRMNVIVETGESGFVENGWIGSAIGVGDEAQLFVALPDPRCVMTTVAQDDLPRDPEVLKTLVRHNRLDVAGGGLFPCAGVYATTGAPGTLRRGQTVRRI